MGTAGSYQLKITLRHSKPPIWRRIVVPSDLLLPELHLVIQVAMGWTDSHLHQFRKADKQYLPRTPDDFDLWDDESYTDYEEVSLSSIMSEPKDKMIYEYDFGDGWEHDVVLEKVLPDSVKYPLCIDGKNACPEEDCGGIGGYYHLLEIINDPSHEEYEEMREWMGMEEEDEFDPSLFDMEEVNDCLREL